MLRTEWKPAVAKKKPQPITAAAAAILEAWLDLNAAHNQPPTLSEVGARTGRAAKTVQFHLLQLEKYGYLIYYEGRHRGVRLRVSQRVARKAIRDALTGGE